MFVQPSLFNTTQRLAMYLLLATAVATGASCSHAADGPHNRAVQFEGATFRVVTLDLAQTRLQLFWRNPETHQAFANTSALRDWGRQHGRHLRFAMNAGIYDANREPLGLFVEHGTTRVPLNRAHGDPQQGNFSLLPNGVFYVDTANQAGVLATDSFAQADIHPRLATQSGPMLVINGKLNPHFIRDSSSLRWRSGVCVHPPQQVLFAVSEEPVNFDTFGRFFRDRLTCRNALYLDGTLSQIHVDGAHYGAPSIMVKPWAGILAAFDHGDAQSASPASTKAER